MGEQDHVLHLHCLRAGGLEQGRGGTESTPEGLSGCLEAGEGKEYSPTGIWRVSDWFRVKPT